MTKTLLTLTALASLTIASQASIFDNQEDAKQFIDNFHQRLGQNVTVSNCSVFVEQTIRGHVYDLAKAYVTNQYGVQILQCYVNDPETQWMNYVTEAMYNYFLATGNRTGWNLPSQLNPLPQPTVEAPAAVIRAQTTFTMSGGNGNALVAAEAQLQAAWDLLNPKVKNLLRAEQRSWIHYKDSLVGEAKIAEINSRTTYLERF